MRLYRLFFLLLLVLATVSCEKDEISTIAPDGEFALDFAFPEEEIQAPAKVFLLNRTKNAESYIWKFEGGKLINGDGEIIDTSRTTGAVPDTIMYELPGTYEVTLEATHNGEVTSLTKWVEVKKRQPRIVVPENILFRQEAQFSAEVFQYPGQPVTYSWNFGNGMTSDKANPKVAFEDAGVYTVTLTINDGKESLTTSAEVTVMGELVKTLYFTDVLSGKLYKYRFTQVDESMPEQLPANVGVHPLGVSIYKNRVIISDAGGAIAYSGSVPAADGRIFSVDLDGNDQYTITQGTGNYLSDPFASAVDRNGVIYWVARNQGVRSMAFDQRDAAYPAVRFNVTAAHAGTSSTWGWVDGGLSVVGNELWYSKQANGKGLYKYNLSGQFIEAVPGLKELKVKSFAVDEVNNKIYFAINSSAGGYDKGLYVSDLDGSNIQSIDATDGFSDEGGLTELTHITDMAIDTNPDDGSAGYLYYGFRSAYDVSATGEVVGDGSRSGIKRYPLDGSGEADFFLQGFIPYGLGIDHVRR